LEREGVAVRFSAQAASGLSFPPLAMERLNAEFERPGDPFAG